MQPRGSVPADQAGSLLNPVICKRRERALRSTTRLPRATRPVPAALELPSLPTETQTGAFHSCSHRNPLS